MLCLLDKRKLYNTNAIDVIVTIEKNTMPTSVTPSAFLINPSQSNGVTNKDVVRIAMNLTSQSLLSMGYQSKAARSGSGAVAFSVASSCLFPTGLL